MLRNLVIAFLVLGQLALAAALRNEHSRADALAERVSQLELVDYHQESANKELEAQINIARQCVNWLLNPRTLPMAFCDQEAIGAEAPWGYRRPGGALEGTPAPEHALRALETRPVK